MGDSAADAVSFMLAPLEALDPKPTVDQVLDALEVVLDDSSVVAGDPLGARHLEIDRRPRQRGSAQASFVEALRAGMPKIVAAYRKTHARAPTLRELVYAIGFVFLVAPETYTSDQTEELGDLEIHANR